MKYALTIMRRSAERGYTLVEVMVAITISVFLLMGLFSVLQQTRQTSGRQSAIAQLQDDERVAMTVLTDIIQQAGYVPEANGSGQSLFVTDGVFLTAGQVFVAGAGAIIGDKLTLRYVLGTNDTTLTCLGQQNSGAEQVYKQIFEINLFNNVQALACSPSNGAGEVPLVNNVANLSFQFAVNSTSASSITAPTSVGPNTEAAHATGYGCPADTYIATASMSQYDWTNVCAVKVDIVFINPLYQPPGQPQPTPGQLQYVTFERVISVLNKTGVDVTSVTQS
jgi:type IV pilus assembly protein PilW